MRTTLSSAKLTSPTAVNCSTRWPAVVLFVHNRQAKQKFSLPYRSLPGRCAPHCLRQNSLRQLQSIAQQGGQRLSFLYIIAKRNKNFLYRTAHYRVDAHHIVFGKTHFANCSQLLNKVASGCPFCT